MRDALESDDLAVALALADQADAVTLARFGAVDLQVDTKPDLTPVSDADHAVETGLRETLGPHPSGRQHPRRGVRRGNHFGRAAVDHRPDRRHQEFRARRTGMGEPDRPAGRRRAPGRGRQCAGVASALVGGRRRGCFRRRRRRPGSSTVGFLSGATRFGQPVVLQPVRLGPARRARSLPGTHRRGVAGARVRRLPVLLLRRRGSGRHRRRAGSVGVGSGAAWTSWSARRAGHSPVWTAPPAHTAETRWPPTAFCTIRSSSRLSAG